MNGINQDFELVRETVVVDIDDTLIDIGERRVKLFRHHFPHAAPEAAESVRFDVGLRTIGDRSSAPANAYLADFANPEIVVKFPVMAVKGAVEAVHAMNSAGLDVILLTGRPVNMREMTLADLASIGLDWRDKKLVMYSASLALDPSDDVGFETFKRDALNSIAQEAEVVAVVGNSVNDVTAAFAANMPAILLRVFPFTESIEDLGNRTHVGFRRCDNWGQALVEIGTFRTGEKQLCKLRDSFTEAYTSWLNNLNHLCAIDVTVASVLAALSGSAILNNSLSWLSRSFAVLPLVMALISLVFAIRAFSSKYSSGSEASRSIAPKFCQAIAILFNLGTPLRRARLGDAICEYSALRSADAVSQASAHRQFFFSRYKTNNPRALLNLRMFEMRSLNYVRAYAEHMASSILIWVATSLVIWVIAVACLDPAFHSIVAKDPMNLHAPKLGKKAASEADAPTTADLSGSTNKATAVENIDGKRR